MSAPTTVIFRPTDAALQSRAEELSARLGLPLTVPTAAVPAGVQFALAMVGHRLDLRDLTTPRSRSIFVDFVASPTGYRRIAAGGRRQPIARALGIRGKAPTVLDATAGLGRDAFLLAVLGCNVTALERSPILFALLEDGLRRAAACDESRIVEAIGRLRLIHANAIEFLTGLRKLPDSGNDRLDASRLLASSLPQVIYLDPMYPPSTKGAQVKKEMRVLRKLVGSDPDADELLLAARTVAASRVVVKRLRHSPPLGPPPSHSIVATRVRYDVYLTTSTSAERTTDQ